MEIAAAAGPNMPAAQAAAHRRRLPPGIAIAAAIGVCSGIAAGALSADVGLAPLAVTAVAVGCIVAGRGRAHIPTSALWLLAIAAATTQLGAWRMETAMTSAAAARARVHGFDGPEQIRGLVADDPIPRGRTVSLTLSSVLVNTNDGWEPLAARVLVDLPPWPDHEYGEYLQVTGKMQALTSSPAAEALGRQGVLATMSYPRVSYLANPQANELLVTIARLRHRLADTIDRTLPQPAADTLKATILGIRSALPKTTQQALINSGTVHLISISGFKLSLLAAGLQLMGLWLLRRTTGRVLARSAVSAVVLAGIAGYTVMTGATPSAVRAALMAGLVVFAALLGRPHDQLTALAVAVGTILVANPLEAQDPGFQLSCLSVLGIALLAQPLVHRLQWPVLRVPGEMWLSRLGRGLLFAIAEGIAVSVAATLFDLPVLATSFHVVSVVSPLANLLGMPLLGPVMAFGGVGALLGTVWLPLGALLLWPAWAFTTLLDWLLNWSGSLPYAALPLDEIAPTAIAIYYAVLLAFTCEFAKRSPRLPTARRRASKAFAWSGMIAGAAAVTLSAIVTSQPPADVRATLLAVPGQAALIQTPSGLAVLVDGGESGPALLRELDQLLAPWQRRLDLLLITSLRSDRIGALADVVGRYSVGYAIEPPDGQRSATLRRLQLRPMPAIPDAIDIGDGAFLRHGTDGWRLEARGASVLFTDSGFEAHTSAGDWRILPMFRGAAAPVDGALALANTGNLAVSLD